MPAAFSPTNRVRTATGSGGRIVPGYTFDSLAVDPAYPASNLIDPDPSLVTRLNYDNNASAGLVETYAQLSASSNKTCRVIAALNCRIPSNVSYVTLYVMDATGTSFTANSRVFYRNQLVPLPGTTDRFDLIDVLSADALGARVAARFSVDANAIDYVEVGHMWAGPAVVVQAPDSGMAMDWEVGTVDSADVERSRGGALVASPGVPRRRTMSANVRAAGRNVALGVPGDATAISLRSLREETGLSTPIIAILRSADVHDLQCLSMYGAFTRIDAVEHTGGNFYSTRMSMEQIR